MSVLLLQGRAHAVYRAEVEQKVSMKWLIGWPTENSPISRRRRDPVSRFPRLNRTEGLAAKVQKTRIDICPLIES